MNSEIYMTDSTNSYINKKIWSLTFDPNVRAKNEFNALSRYFAYS